MDIEINRSGWTVILSGGARLNLTEDSAGLLSIRALEGTLAIRPKTSNVINVEVLES